MPMGKHRSVDASRFAMVPRSDIPRSAFDVAFSHKTTFDSGYLVPVYVDEVLPGDSIRLRMTAFARLATPIVPVMDNLILESFFFYCPARVLWGRWERFMGEQQQITDTTEYLMPQMSLLATDLVVGTLGDYFGITLNGAPGPIDVNPLPFRMYNLVYNDFFRDEDLQTFIDFQPGDGPDDPAWYLLRRRAKRHDYFTTARPWPQKPINMSDSGTIGGPLAPGARMVFPQAGAPVSGLGASSAATVGPLAFDESGGRLDVPYARYYDAADLFVRAGDNGGDFPNLRVLINDIRTANAVQVMLERNARGGTRYTEIVRSHFGVTSPDARLQRPEYLGGGRAHVTVNPVAQTSASGVAGTTTVLGELAGVGSAVATGHGFSQSFTEHGYILGIISVRADLTYQQGLERLWKRRTQYDFYWPGLANLGEQAIWSYELFSDGTADDNLVFGYQERWSEYKYKPSRVSGSFRSNTPTPLDMWHFAQYSIARPLLNSNFIQEDPPVERVLQVETTDGNQFLIDTLFDVRYVRPMPMHSIPGLGPRL